MSHHRPGGKTAELPRRTALSNRHHHISLRLIRLGERRSLDRAWIEHGRLHRATAKIGRERLMPMDVARQHSGEFGRHVGVANHVLRGRELEVHRPNGRTFGRLVHAQHTGRCGVRLPFSVGDELRELRSHVAPLTRESRQREGRTASLDDERARPVEDVDVRMRGKTRVRKKRALVISRDDEHGHPHSATRRSGSSA